MGDSLPLVPFQTYTKTLTALGTGPGSTFKVPGKISFIAVLTSTDPAGVAVSFSNGTYFPLPVGVSISEFAPSPDVYVQNMTANPITITLACGNATYRDNRFVFDYSGTTLPTSMADGADIALGSTASAAAVSGAVAASLIGIAKGIFNLLLAKMPGSSTAWNNTGTLTTNGVILLKAAGGAGVIRRITSLQLVPYFGGVATDIEIYDGATVIAQFTVPASTALLPVPPQTYVFPEPLFSSANTALNIKALTAASNVVFNVQGN